MITFHVESYDTSYKDIQKLYMIHWKEISKFSFEANIDWDLFAKLYALGNLFIATARKNERMIGYFISYMFPHIRYKDKIFADNDTIFILPEYREGWTGYKFIKFACTELKKELKVCGEFSKKRNMRRFADVRFKDQIVLFKDRRGR